MSNTENLIPMNKRTKDEQREIARSGGIASGISRNNKKSFKEMINCILDTKLNLLDSFNNEYLPESNHRALVALGLIKSAENGNIKALQTLLELTEEKNIPN